MKNKLVNILIDFAFKKVFAGNGEESKYILRDFLNSILELKGKNKIKEIIYLNPFNDREHEKDKQSIMDIKVKTELDELIDIEVQINDVDDYRKRSLYYWSKLYGESIKKGKPYYELKKSIVINILDFNIIEENNKYHNVFVIKERDENTLFIEDLEIHYIELRKFNIKKAVKEFTDLEEWVAFLKECSEGEDSILINELTKNKEEISVAMGIIEELSASEKEYQEYLAREKYIMDEISKREYAKRKMNLIKEQMDEMKGKLGETKDKLDETKGKLDETKDKLDETKDKLDEAKDKLHKTDNKLKAANETIINLAKELLDILDNETIALKTGLTIEEIESLR